MQSSTLESLLEYINSSIKCFTAKKISKFASERLNQSKKSTNEAKVFNNNATLSNIIIGNIVERNENDENTKTTIEKSLFRETEGFPRPKRIDRKVSVFSSLYR